MNTEIWARFVERLKQQVNDRFLPYVENMSCAAITDHEWHICLPDSASLNYVESNLAEKLHEVLRDILRDARLPVDVAILLSLEGDESPCDRKSSGSLFETVNVTDVSKPDDVKQAAFRYSGTSPFDRSSEMEAIFVPDIKIRENSRLNPRYTFDSFIKGGSNEMAYCAAKAVAASPGASYNPLFIYGGVGLGKTHLMHAIGNEILETSNLRVLYKTTEEFTNEYLDALSTNRMKEFRDSIRRDCDVLLLDDIQFISGKTETQKEFFNAFNDLLSANKQIILTSDKHPKEISQLEERMRSRFLQGLTTDIQLPEFETRLEIVRKKSRAERFFIPEDVAQYIAAKVTSNIRELEGVIKRVKACADIHNEHVSLELAKKLIDPFYQTRNVLLNADTLIEHVCRYFGLSTEEMLGKSRAKQYVYPRQIAMYLARKHTALSFPDLGRVFRRDHTTVLSAYQRIIKELGEKNATLQSDIKFLEDELFK